MIRTEAPKCPDPEWWSVGDRRVIGGWPDQISLPGWTTTKTKEKSMIKARDKTKDGWGRGGSISYGFGLLCGKKWSEQNWREMDWWLNRGEGEDWCGFLTGSVSTDQLHKCKLKHVATFAFNSQKLGLWSSIVFMANYCAFGHNFFTIDILISLVSFCDQYLLNFL